MKEACFKKMLEHYEKHKQPVLCPICRKEIDTKNVHVVTDFNPNRSVAGFAATGAGKLERHLE